MTGDEWHARERNRLLGEAEEMRSAAGHPGMGPKAREAARLRAQRLEALAEEHAKLMDVPPSG